MQFYDLCAMQPIHRVKHKPIETPSEARMHVGVQEVKLFYDRDMDVYRDFKKGANEGDGKNYIIILENEELRDI